jgi:hypothetical protein
MDAVYIGHGYDWRPGAAGPNHPVVLYAIDGGFVAEIGALFGGGVVGQWEETQRAAIDSAADSWIVLYAA